MKNWRITFAVVLILLSTWIGAQSLESFPTEIGGRVMPLKLAAGLVLYETAREYSWKGQDALTFLQGLWTDPEAWNKEELLFVKNPEVFAALGMMAPASGRLAPGALDLPIKSVSVEAGKELLRLKSAVGVLKNWVMTFTPGAKAGLALVPGQDSWLTPWQAMTSKDPIQRELGQLWLYWDFNFRSGQKKEAESVLGKINQKMLGTPAGKILTLVTWESWVVGAPLGPVFFSLSALMWLLYFFFLKKRGRIWPWLVALSLGLCLLLMLVLRTLLIGVLPVTTLQGNLWIMALFSLILGYLFRTISPSVVILLFISWVIGTDWEPLSPVPLSVWNPLLMAHFLLIDLGMSLGLIFTFGNKTMSSRVLLWTVGILFMGIILGGLWSQFTWGTFWTWSQKESANLAIVLWFASLYQAHKAGKFPARLLQIMGILSLGPLLFAILKS